MNQTLDALDTQVIKVDNQLFLLCENGNNAFKAAVPDKHYYYEAACSADYNQYYALKDALPGIVPKTALIAKEKLPFNESGSYICQNTFVKMGQHITIDEFARKSPEELENDFDKYIRHLKEDIEQKSSDKSLIMEATFLITADGKPLTLDDIKKNDWNLDIGTIRFIIDGQEVPFDFSATAKAQNEDGSITYGNFDGLFLKECDIDYEVFELDYKEIGLKRENITAEYLARASEIAEFFVSVSDYNDEDIPFEFTLNEIVFLNENDEEFFVDDTVIRSFNHVFSKQLENEFSELSDLMTHALASSIHQNKAAKGIENREKNPCISLEK